MLSAAAGAPASATADADAPALATKGAAAEGSMMPSGMATDSWYFDHDCSPSRLVKAFRRRDLESGLTMTMSPGFSALTLDMKLFISSRTFFRKDWVASAQPPS